MSPARAIVLVSYCASGAAALIYEVLWVRLLTLYLDHSVAAVSTVLAAFMGGLAAGAAAAGRLAPVLSRGAALRWFGRLELAVAVAALTLGPALNGLQPLLAVAYRDGAGGLAFGAARTLVALGLVGVPTTLMGATLPLVTRWYSTRAPRAGVEVGALYAVNTAGAVAGASLAGFWLVPSFGLARSTLVGVACNVVAAVLAIAVSRRPIEAPAPLFSEVPARGRGSQERHHTGPPPAPPRHGHAAAAVLALSGAAALAFEVVWTRLLALVVGPTVYAFAAMLVCVIGGLAIGSAVGAAVAREPRRARVALAVALLVPAATATVLGWRLDALPLLVASVVARPGATFETVARVQAGLIAALLVPMSLGFGAAFPLALTLATGRDDRVAAETGRLYTTNTVGAIAGALGTGFFLMPRFGLQGGLRTATLLALASAALAAMLLARERRRRAALLVATAATATFAATMPPWNRALLTGGGYKYAAYLGNTDLQAHLEAGRLLYDADGAVATVTVRETAGARSLAIDGKVDASNAGDMVTQKLLAHLPLLLHRAPTEVLVIGLGSGVTAGAALRHPVTRVDVVEISPDVVAASRYFSAENHEALRDRRTRLILGDGRAHLRLATSRYDAIISEPSNPWMAGIAPLFTRELFDVARRRLKPRGIFCQWAHTYDISDSDLRSIVATFAAVFPHGTMWLVGEGDLLLLGSDRPLEAGLDQLARAWRRPGVAADLAEVDVRSPFVLLSTFIGGNGALRRYGAGGRIQTDDHTPLEFSAPRSIYGTAADPTTALRALAAAEPLPKVVADALAAATAQDWVDRGTMDLKAEAYRTAFEDFVRALRLDPEHPGALDGLIQAAAGAARQTDALALLAELARARPNSATLPLARSRLLAAMGEYERALQAAEQAVRASAGQVEAVLQVASVLADAGDAERLGAVVARLGTLAPDQPATAYYTATLHFLQGRFDAAAAVAEALVARAPADHRTWNLLGAAYGNLGRADRARQAFDAALRANPRDPATHVNLGLFELQAANPKAAAAHFAEALVLDPQSRAALAGLADALERQGDVGRARRLRSQLGRLDSAR